MDKRDIIETGFKAGYRLYTQTPVPEANLLPDCPFPLRTGERALWLTAWGAGKTLARQHRVAADAAIDALEEEQEA